MGSLISDLGYALKRLLRSSGPTAVALLLIALGIGANAAVFSVANGVLLRPLPYHEPDTIIRIWESNYELGQMQFEVSPGTYVHWRDHSTTLSQIACFYSGGRGAVITEPENAEWVSEASISPSLLSLLGVTPILGRSFLVEEDHRVVLISHGLWHRRFNRRPETVGSSLSLDGRDYTIIGVLPHDFAFPEAVDLWRPMSFRHRIGLRERGTRYLETIGRLRPGVSIAEARADLENLAGQLSAEFPTTNRGWGVTVLPLHEAVVENVRPALLALLTAVLLALLLGCFNLANLFLAKAMGRRQELAIRSALGAGRWRLLRLLLVESILLGLGGGALGLLLAVWGTRFLMLIAPANLPGLERIVFDVRVLGYGLGLSLLAGIAAGILPALKAASWGANEFLRVGPTLLRRGGDAAVSKLLIGAEVTLAVVLLITSGLVMKSFVQLLHANPGFDSDHLLTAEMQLPRRGRPPDNRVALTQLGQRIVEQCEIMPGVESAAITSAVPLGGRQLKRFISLPARNAGNRWPAIFNTVSWQYFKTMRIPLLEGRLFDQRDLSSSEPVAIVNNTLARQLRPDGEVLGEAISIELESGRARRVVGVVADVKNARLVASPSPEVYVPHPQAPLHLLAVVARIAPEHEDLAAEIQNRLRRVDSNLVVYACRWMSELLTATLPQPRFVLALLCFFALAALALATVGVYAVVGLGTKRRRKEIAIRLAVGAGGMQVLGLVVSGALKAIAAGLILGLLAALAATRFLASILYGVEPNDVATLAIVTLGMAVAGLVAAYLPARRASRVDPAETFRWQ